MDILDAPRHTAGDVKRAAKESRLENDGAGNCCRAWLWLNMNATGLGFRRWCAEGFFVLFFSYIWSVCVEDDFVRSLTTPSHDNSCLVDARQRHCKLLSMSKSGCEGGLGDQCGHP